MSKKQTGPSGEIPAVGYLRRSTSRQERSLQDQRREIENYAKQNGYRILRWYTDDGISGDATECRHEFLKMHKAATNGRDFDAILAWDYSRFGRFDSIEAGRWIHPLRQAGVKLVTVAEGLVDWDCFSGRIMNALHAEGKHSYLTDLSRNVARSLAGVAREGRLCGQAAPYGFDRMLVDEHGEQRQRIRTGEKFSKPRGWRTMLVPSDDARKVSTLRWLFQSYADMDVGLRGLADQLNAKGVPGPTGGPWYAASIKAILENQSYAGTLTWSKRRQGKYHFVAAGQVQERERSEVALSPTGKARAIDNPKEAWIVVENAHEPLIDKAVFERVQAKLHFRRRSQPSASYRTHTKGNGDSYLLSGLVYCARCGCKMHGSMHHNGRNRYPRYVCSSYARSGRHNPHGCGRHGVTQDRLVDVLVRKLQQMVLSTDSLERLRKALRQQISQRRNRGNQGAEQLGKRLADLDKAIDRAAENFIRAPAEVLDVLGKKLTSLKRQREHINQELRESKTAAKPQDVDDQIESAVGRLWRLGEEMAKADPARRREVFRLFVSRIDLRFDQVKRGKRTMCQLKSGEIHLRSEEGTIFGSVNRGGA